MAQVRLAGFTAAFFAGRAVSYLIYAFTARSISDSSIGDPLPMSRRELDLTGGAGVFVLVYLRVPTC